MLDPAETPGSLVSMPARPLRGVAIGAGYFSQFHFEAWSRLENVQLTAVYDRDGARAAQAVARFGIGRAAAEWRSMIDEEAPDFVDVITPPDSHADICAFAASRGVHIVCQKPLAPTLAAARQLVDGVERAGVRMMVHENFRWQPWYRAAKNLERSGHLGRFTHVHVLTRLGDGWSERAYMERQPYFRHYPRLLLFETGVHFIDTFRFLLGEVTSVFARIRRLNPAIAGEDTGLLFLEFDTGATAVWDASRYTETEASSPRYTFGEIRIDATGGHLTVDTAARMRMKPLGGPASEVDYPHEDRGFAGDSVYAVQRHFVECLRSGAPFESTGRDYLKTMAVVEAAYESAGTSRFVSLVDGPEGGAPEPLRGSFR